MYTSSRKNFRVLTSEPRVWRPFRQLWAWLLRVPVWSSLLAGELGGNKGIGVVQSWGVRVLGFMFRVLGFRVLVSFLV